MPYIPAVIIKTDRQLSDEQLRRIKDGWKKYCEQIQFGYPAALVLDGGLDIVPLNTTSAIPDAICRYCSVANLSTSVWCQACGAPMIREASYA